MKLKTSAFPTWLLSLAILCTTPHVANAGIKITADIQESKNHLPMTLFMDKTKVRMDSQFGADGQSHRIIYDGTSDNLAYLDVKRKTAMQLPMAQLQMIAAMALRLQSGKKTQGPQPPAKVDMKFVKTSRTKKVGNWNCQIFEIRKLAKKVGELCTASLSEVGLTPADLAPLQKLSKSIRPLIEAAPGAPNYPDYLWEKVNELGFALEANDTDPASKKTFTMSVSSITKDNFASDTFDTPADFKQQSFKMGK